MIVVDASALAKYVLREEGWEAVAGYLRRARPLYSVDHVLKEVANALWKHVHLAKAIDAGTALELCRALGRLAETGVIVLENELKYLGRALEIALEYGLTVYDALYVAQAEKYGELLTSDEEQGRVAGSFGITVHRV
uniref:PIN domain-containing protein n=1 Tax=Thermofilum pendens TaxID=2269 RepID=A0A7J3X6D8_THEPE